MEKGKILAGTPYNYLNFLISMKEVKESVFFVLF